MANDSALAYQKKVQIPTRLSSLARRLDKEINNVVLISLLGCLTLAFCCVYFVAVGSLLLPNVFPDSLNYTFKIKYEWFVQARR